MNAPHSPSPLAAVPMAPSDPILGVTEAYVAEQSPKKVNLGVGVYYDNDGKIPVLECVRHAESERLKAVAPRGYLPIDGIAAYDKAVQALVFGKDAKALQENRIVTVQALGGTGGLKIGADLEPAGAAQGLHRDDVLRLAAEDQLLHRAVVGGDAVDRQVAARRDRLQPLAFGVPHALQHGNLAFVVVIDPDAEIDLARILVGDERLGDAEDGVARRHRHGGEEGGGMRGVHDWADSTRRFYSCGALRRCPYRSVIFMRRFV